MNGGIPYAVVSGKFKAVEHGLTTEKEIVPVKITLSNEFCDPEFNQDDILQYDLDRVIDSKDGKGWTKWWTLKGVSESSPNRTCFKGICKN